MKTFILITFTILIFSIFSFAQTEENSPCPSVSVIGPSGLVKAGDSVTFVAQLSNESENFPVKYNWTVERGEITSGQGTSIITVESKVGFEMGITATVEVSGLPENCGILTASDGAYCTLTPPEPEKVSEFAFSNSAKDEEYLSKFAQELKDKPNDSGYILIYSETDLSKNEFNKREQKIRQFLTKIKNIESERFTIVNAGEIKNSIQLWLVPPGAELPTP